MTSSEGRKMNFSYLIAFLARRVQARVHRTLSCYCLLLQLSIRPAETFSIVCLAHPSETFFRNCVIILKKAGNERTKGKVSRLSWLFFVQKSNNSLEPQSDYGRKVNLTGGKQWADDVSLIKLMGITSGSMWTSILRPKRALWRWHLLIFGFLPIRVLEGETTWMNIGLHFCFDDNCYGFGLSERGHNNNFLLRHLEPMRENLSHKSDRLLFLRFHQHSVLYLSLKVQSAWAKSSATKHCTWSNFRLVSNPDEFVKLLWESFVLKIVGGDDDSNQAKAKKQTSEA